MNFTRRINPPLGIPSTRIANLAKSVAKTVSKTVVMAVVCFAPVAAGALEELPANQEHRGVVMVDLYQIFPENRLDNAVYYDNRLVLSVANQTISHISPLPKEGRFVYLAKDAQGKSQVRVYVQHQDRQARVETIAPGHHFVVVVLDGVVYKKLYRVVEGNRLVDLLPQSKTADGAQAGEPGVVFYHVSTVVEREGVGDETYKEFGIRLHLSAFDSERLLDLDFPIFNALPELKIEWVGPNQIMYTLADGRQELISISQFQ